jgi:preprotein translocase SecE subunit
MTGVWVLFATAAWKCSNMDFHWVAGWWTWLAGWNAQLETLRETFKATTDAVVASGLTDQIKELEDKMGAFVRTFVPVFTYTLSALVLLLGLWFGYRLVNWVTFSDFLISVEGEMAKVSWPGKAELRSSTIVVLAVFLLLSGMIYIYDLVLLFIFRFINVM